MKTPRMMTIVGSAGWGIGAGAMALAGRYFEAAMFAFVCIGYVAIAIKSRKPS